MRSLIPSITAASSFTWGARNKGLGFKLLFEPFHLGFDLGVLPGE